MKLTTITQVSVDGVVQGNGGPDENRSGGFERGGWARPLFDSEAMTFVNQVYQRADAFLFGRRTNELSSATRASRKIWETHRRFGTDRRVSRTLSRCPHRTPEPVLRCHLTDSRPAASTKIDVAVHERGLPMISAAVPGQHV